jgi:hypothetical protein
MDAHITSSRADCPALPKQKNAKLMIIYDFPVVFWFRIRAVFIKDMDPQISVCTTGLWIRAVFLKVTVWILSFPYVPLDYESGSFLCGFYLVVN